MAERKNVSALELLDQLPAGARVVVLPPATDDDPHPGPKAAPTSLFAATGAGLTPAQVRNVVAAFVEAGAGIAIARDAVADTLTITLEIPAATIKVDMLTDTLAARLLPAPGAGQAGRIVEISSQGKWVSSPVEWDIEDLAAAVVARLLPTGGTQNQALAKSADNASIAWRAVSTLIANGSITVSKLAAALVNRILPTGGADGQFLGRSSGSAAWVAAPAGGGPGVDATARAEAEANAAALNSVDYVVDRLGIALRTLSGWRVGAWADADAEATDAGFAIGFWELNSRPAAYTDVTWQATHVDVTQSTGYFFALRVPSGFPVDDFLRIQQRRSGGSAIWPTTAQSWRPLALTGAPRHFDIYALYDSEPCPRALDSGRDRSRNAPDRSPEGWQSHRHLPAQRRILALLRQREP